MHHASNTVHCSHVHCLVVRDLSSFSAYMALVPIYQDSRQLSVAKDHSLHERTVFLDIRKHANWPHSRSQDSLPVMRRNLSQNRAGQEGQYRTIMSTIVHIAIELKNGRGIPFHASEGIIWTRFLEITPRSMVDCTGRPVVYMPS